MYKIKTKSSAKKRFRITATGKVEQAPKMEGKQMTFIIQPLK